MISHGKYYFQGHYMYDYDRDGIDGSWGHWDKPELEPEPPHKQWSTENKTILMKDVLRMDSSGGKGCTLYRDVDGGLNVDFQDSNNNNFNVDGDINAENHKIIAQSFRATSDIAFKKDIMPVINAENIIDQLNPVYWNWKQNNGSDCGLIAQDVQKIIPDAVDMDGEYMTINYNYFIGLMMGRMKEMDAEMKDLSVKLSKI